MTIEFQRSELDTLGVELELQLVDADTLDLADRISELMDSMSACPYVKPEFIQNTVEIASKVCTSTAELEAHLDVVLAELKHSCAGLGLRLVGAGTHPFSTQLGTITPTRRYRRLATHEGLLAHLQIVFATHVHVGVRDGEEALRLMRGLKPLLAVLVALSANSPYWRGYETGFVSYRHRILAASRSYGIPPSFPDWGHFERFMETVARAGVFESINDVHWDIRPRPHLGSLEVRTMDAQSTIGDTVAIASLVRALAFVLRRGRPEQIARLPRQLPWWLEKENYYQASRLGLEARFIASEAGEVRDLTDVAREVIAVAAPVARELGDERSFAGVEALRLRPGYVRQREVVACGGNVAGVVAQTSRRLYGTGSAGCGAARHAAPRPS